MLVAENKGITAIRSYPGYSYAAVGGKTRKYKNKKCGKPAKRILYLRVLPPGAKMRIYIEDMY